ncbi:MAG: hypothetical protein PHO83_14435 [Geobacteraceae bacterium]|nr:hypothetical protein [Geobacteraceae bacterium]
MFSIKVNNSRIVVTSMYNTLFVAEAKNIDGKWSETAKAWVFDVRDEQRVRDLCMKYYGTDGVVNDLCTLKVKWLEDEKSKICSAITVYGRPVAKAKGRYTGATLQDGIVLIEGAFTSGGSWQKWVTYVDGGTEVLIRSFPHMAAKDLISDQSNNIIYSIEVEESPSEHDALNAERERIIERLAEIDKRLTA